VTRAIAVTFDRDPQGRVVGLSIYTEGFRFEVPRIGVEHVGEIPLEDLGRYLGRYVVEGPGNEIELIVLDGRLAVSIQGLPDLLLHPPDEEGIWTSRTHEGIELSFEEDAEGEVASLSLVTPWFRGTAPRVAGVPESTLPTLEEILELRDNAGRGRRLAKLAGVRFAGKVSIPQSGVTGDFAATAAGLRYLRHEFDLGRFGFMRYGQNGDVGWAEEMSGEVHEITGVRLAELQAAGPLVQAADWFEVFDAARVLGRESLDGREGARIKLTFAGDRSVTALVDLESGDTIEERGATTIPGDLGSVPYVTRYADWREVDGLRVAHRMTTELPESGRTILVIEEVETGLEYAEGHFTPPR